jgi:thiol-disulfide isomerase/thioredoxin
MTPVTLRRLGSARLRILLALGATVLFAAAPPAERLDLLLGETGAYGEAFLREPGGGASPVVAATIDWVGWSEALLGLGCAFPESRDDRIRSAAADFFRRADRWAPGVAAATRLKMASNASALLRELAAAHSALAAARSVPLAMKFTAVDGREIDLAQLRGKVVLIDFWAATWCGACKVQEPLMKEVYARYHAQGFEIIGVACEMKESDRDFLLDYVQKHDMPWPQYFDGQGMNNEYALRYGFTSIPQFFLLDRDGLLVAHTHGSGGLRNLEALVRRELGLSSLQPGDEDKVLGK